MSGSRSVLESFAEAIRTCEETGDVDAVVALYASDCVCGNVLKPEEYTGAEGAREFWSRYRAQFDDVTSTFLLIAGDDDGGVLEWETTGSFNDQPVGYRGVTVLELGDGAIVRSCAYFDPTALAHATGPA